jgi:hypothetical protein
MPENAAADKVCLALKQRECHLHAEAMLKALASASEAPRDYLRPVRPLVPWLPRVSALEDPGISALEDPGTHLLPVRSLVPCQRGQLHCL